MYGTPRAKSRICVHAPIEGSDEITKDNFYDRSEEVDSKIA